MTSSDNQKQPSEFQRTRKAILDLLELILHSDREDVKTNPDLWKIYIDNAVERIELIYKGEKID